LVEKIIDKILLIFRLNFRLIGCSLWEWYS